MSNEAEALLKLQFDKYAKFIDDEVWAEVEGYYHPSGVLVHKGKEAVYGNKDKSTYIAKFAEGTGKSVGTTTNAKYEGSGDYLIITADFSSETEKAGTVKGRFVQI
ncbi:DUF4440 domain-containing protein [Caenorhabditis elegans]|uniref:DUF4440 domain-containing protein n=1 Tax=Caenorhabditis elegans TaxID=6239 RepID=A0A078BPI4_CAEEL|nr:DUF4440 domain-containing protein [Caenorhabditis elegans]CDX47469.1 DUF4440 domain-containing protein [Caenorhabditis elegans]|eukprot:NP_001294104.1 Uncharacterized protein CELE_F38C2.1 [Caenorhabditis elegans]